MRRTTEFVTMLGLLAVALSAAPGASPTRRLDTPALEGSGMYSLATGADNQVYLSLIDTSPDNTATLRFSRLIGGKWTAAATIATGRDWFVNWADHPSITALPNGTLVAHWLVNNPGSIGHGYGIRMAQSDDRGQTWREFFKAGLEHKTDYSGFVSFLPGATGVSAAYLTPTLAHGSPGGQGDAGHGTEHVKSLKIARFGLDGQLVSDLSVDADVCTCCSTAMVETTDGPIAAYRDHQGAVRDIAVVRLRGGQWTAPATVHKDNWLIDGCPTNGPVLAARDRRVAIAWFTAANDQPHVRLSFSGDAGASFSAPTTIDGGKPVGYPSLVMLEDGSVVVSWLESLTGGKGEVRLRRVWPDGRLGQVVVVAPANAGRSAGLPKLARSADGLVVAWRDERVLSATTPVPQQ